MLERYTDEQLMSHLIGLGQWTQIRARELKHFTEQLPAKMAEAGEDPVRQATLRYALHIYIDGVQDLVHRCREVQAEVDRRTAVTA